MAGLGKALGPYVYHNREEEEGTQGSALGEQAEGLAGILLSREFTCMHMHVCVIDTVESFFF